MVAKMKDDEKASGMKKFVKIDDKGNHHGVTTSDPEKWKELIANGWKEVFFKEDELEEGTFGPHNLPNAKKDDDAIALGPERLAGLARSWKTRAKPDFLDIDDDSALVKTTTTKKTSLKKAAEDKKEVDEDCDYREEAIEETVEVPLSELADLLRLAGYENYEEKLSEYENEPEEEYFDVEHQLIGLAGGLNRPKIMHPTVAGGDNPMAVIPVKVDEEEDMVEKIYQNYRSFVDEAMQEQCSTNK
jgi:hypothetical protein